MSNPKPVIAWVEVKDGEIYFHCIGTKEQMEEYANEEKHLTGRNVKFIEVKMTPVEPNEGAVVFVERLKRENHELKFHIDQLKAELEKAKEALTIAEGTLDSYSRGKSGEFMACSALDRIQEALSSDEPKPHSPIKQACDDYMFFLRSERYHEDMLGDYEKVIFEASMEHYLGKDIWKEISERMKS